MRNLHCGRLSRDSLSQERDNGIYHRDLDIRNLVRCRLDEDTGWQGNDCLGQGRMLGGLRLLNETQWGDFIKISKIISSLGRLVPQSRCWNAGVKICKIIVVRESKLSVRVEDWFGMDPLTNNIVTNDDNWSRVFLGVVIDVE